MSKNGYVYLYTLIDPTARSPPYIGKPMAMMTSFISLPTAEK